MNHEIIVEAALELKDVQEVNLFFTRTSRLMLAVVFFLMVIGIVLLVDENRTGMEFMIAFLLDVLLSVILWLRVRVEHSPEIRKSVFQRPVDAAAPYVRVFGVGLSIRIRIGIGQGPLERYL